MLYFIIDEAEKPSQVIMQNLRIKLAELKIERNVLFYFIKENEFNIMLLEGTQYFFTKEHILKINRHYFEKEYQEDKNV